MALVVGVFGRGRPSKAELMPQPAPVWGEAHDPFEFPVIAGLSAAFAQHFRMRLMTRLLSRSPRASGPRV